MLHQNDGKNTQKKAKLMQMVCMSITKALLMMCTSKAIKRKEMKVKEMKVN